MKDMLIWCNTKEKLEKVAQKLKSDEFNIPKTETMWGSYGAELVISVHTEYKDVTYCSRDWYKKRDYRTPITADEFLGKGKNPAVVIFRRDRNVIAKNVATGDEGIAKCSPDDEFNFHTGASIALARLMSKVPATGVLNPDVRAEWTKLLGITETPTKVYTDADRNFKVGDRVVVRDWDDMEKEYDGSKFSLSPNGCVTAFTTPMKHLCGRTATIIGTGSEDYVSVEFDDKSGKTNWYYRKWMFNPIDSAQSKKPEAKFKVGDYVTLKEDVEADKWYGGLELLSGAMYDNARNKRVKVIRADWSDDSNTYFYECKGDCQFTFHYSEEMLDKCDESKIYEGDTVKVVNTGLNYSSYAQWVGKHISDPYMAARFCFGSPSLDEKYKVIKIAEHESNYRPLAYIEQIDGIGFNKCYLIEVKGLEKV